MKKHEKISWAYVLCFIVAICSCKKNSDTANTPQLSSNNKVVSFTTNAQLTNAAIDTVNHTINIAVSYTANRAALVADVELPAGATALINGSKFTGGNVTLNCSIAPIISVMAQNGNSVSWTILVTTDLEQYGLGNSVTADKSWDKTYPWYIDQGTTGADEAVNCGPSSVTMAIKWADSTFNKTAEYARNTFRENDGWWYTTDIQSYLTLNNINWKITNLPNLSQTQNMESCIDQGNILILCLDNYYLTYNSVATQHVGRFYTSYPGSGHFILIKGYKRVDNVDYFDAYDPACEGAVYPNTANLKGQDRYYTSADLATATNIWWPYAIVVAPKGKQVTLSATGLKTFSMPEEVPVQWGR